MADLEKYKDGYQEINSIIKLIPESIIEFIPAYENSWSIKEHIIHLVDSETNGLIRLKSIIAQPGSDCYVMDEDIWTKNIRRKKEDINKYMQLLKSIREIAYDFIKDEVKESWNTQYFIRTYQGKTLKITIENWIDLYNNHLAFHINYINKIIETKKGENL